MDHKHRLRSLLDKYFHNTCTKSEMQELLDFLKRAENEPEIKRLLSEAWQEISESDISERLTSRERTEWFKKIYSEAHMRENIPFTTRFRKVKSGKSALFSYRHTSSQWIKVAAILLFSVVFSLAYYTVMHEESPDSVEFVRKVAGPGEKARFVLSDGTQVHLNSESWLEYSSSFEGSTRDVRLEGEAYFVVARDEAHPFLVHTNKITTRVLGTSFSVRSYPEDSEAVVAVASGRVAVTESGSTSPDTGSGYDVVLEANQWTNYAFDEHRFDTESGDISAFTAWNNGVLLYQDKKLGEVARQLERWYGVDITFENEAIKNCVIRGEHRDETLENVLEAVTYAFVDMKYLIEDRHVVFSGEGCK